MRFYCAQRWDAAKLAARIAAAGDWARRHHVVVLAGEFGASQRLNAARAPGLAHRRARGVRAARESAGRCGATTIRWGSRCIRRPIAEPDRSGPAARARAAAETSKREALPPRAPMDRRGRDGGCQKAGEKKKPPVSDRGQVNREASRLGDAGVIDPLPTPKSRNTGGNAAVFDGSTVMVRCDCDPSAKTGSRHAEDACPDGNPSDCGIGAAARLPAQWNAASRDSRKSRNTATRFEFRSSSG